MRKELKKGRLVGVVVKGYKNMSVGKIKMKGPGMDQYWVKLDNLYNKEDGQDTDHVLTYEEDITLLGDS